VVRKDRIVPDRIGEAMATHAMTIDDRARWMLVYKLMISVQHMQTKRENGVYLLSAQPGAV
jgi:hypothetical protein